MLFLTKPIIVAAMLSAGFENTNLSIENKCNISSYIRKPLKPALRKIAFMCNAIMLAFSFQGIFVDGDFNSLIFNYN